MPVTFTTGLNYENMSEDRRGYENFVMNNGVPDYGVKGDKRRNERNLMWNVDPYLQTSWQLTQKLSVDAGVRYSSVWFDSNDHYVTPGNGDDSGDASYHKWLPGGLREVCGDGRVEPLRCRRAWVRNANHQRAFVSRR